MSSITVFHGRDQGPNYKNEDPLDENMYSLVEVMYNANGAKFLLLCNERTAYPQIYVFAPLQEEVYVNSQYVINPLFTSSWHGLFLSVQWTERVAIRWRPRLQIQRLTTPRKHW